jgi:DNA-binding CsgD family transcriptional regulator
MAIDGQGTSATDGARVARTVAYVNLRPSPEPRAERDPCYPSLLGIALDQIRHTVRPGDRICPYAVSHIAVEFGPDADAVTPRLLGQRLARAVGQGLVDTYSAPSRVDPARSPTKVAGPRHDNDRRPGARRPPVTIPSTMVVTVERVFDGVANGLRVRHPTDRQPVASAPAGSGGTEERGVAPRRRQRAVVRYSPGGLGGAGTRQDDRARTTRDDQAVGTVLVVDPDPAIEGKPGLAAVAAAELAERIGFVAGTIALRSDDGLIAEIGGRPLDAVVLVVGSEPADEQSSWWASTWSIPARLADAYRSKGIGVLAVSAGASVAAMTSCVECGAAAAFDLSDMRELLLEIVGGSPAAEPTPGPDRRHLPRGAEGLLRLTGAERRVLFYLTTGRSPQAIADDLVVSLATVRSHIRSVLRKLGVRSQLAAVAVATSRARPPEPSAQAFVVAVDDRAPLSNRAFDAP